MSAKCYTYQLNRFPLADGFLWFFWIILLIFFQNQNSTTFADILICPCNEHNSRIHNASLKRQAFYSHCWSCKEWARRVFALQEYNETHEIAVDFNPFVPNAPFLYPLKTWENCSVDWKGMGLNTTLQLYLVLNFFRPETGCKFIVSKSIVFPNFLVYALNLITPKTFKLLDVFCSF